MSDKSELNKLNDELGRIWVDILSIVDKNPSIMLYFDKDGMSQSISSFCEQYDDRVQYLRKQLRKAADKMPKGRRTKKNV